MHERLAGKQAFSGYFTVFVLLAVIFGFTVPIDYSGDLVFVVPQIIVFSLIFLIIYFLVLKMRDNVYLLISLTLMVRLTLFIIPLIKYGARLDPNPDGYYHIWFTNTIIKYHHVPLKSTYSGMPFAHLMSASMAEVLGVDSTVGIYLVGAVLSLATFLGYLIIIKKYINKSYILNFFMTLLLISLPYESFIPFYFRPRIYSLLFILFIYYYIFEKRSSLLIGRHISNDLILIILFISTLFINISYAMLLVSVIFIFYLLLIFDKNHSTSVYSLGTVISLFTVISIIKLIYDYIFLKIIFKLKNLLIAGKVASIPSVAASLSIKFKILGIMLVYGRIIIPVFTLLFIYFYILLIKNKNLGTDDSLRKFLSSLAVIIFTYSPVILIIDKNISDALRAFYFALAFTTPMLIILLFSNKSKVIELLIILGITLTAIVYVPTTYSMGYVDPNVKVNNYTIPLVEWSYSDGSQRISSLLFLKYNLNYENKRFIVLADRNSILMLLKYSPRIFISGLVYHNITLLLESKIINNNYIIIIHLDKKAGIYEESLNYRIPEQYKARLIWLSTRISIIYNNGLVYQLHNNTISNYYP